MSTENCRSSDRKLERLKRVVKWIPCLSNPFLPGNGGLAGRDPFGIILPGVGGHDAKNPK